MPGLVLLVFRFGLALAIMSTLLWILARLLKHRFPHLIQAASLILPCLLLLSYLVPDQIMFPTAIVSRAVPGAEASTMGSRHDKLNDVVYQLAPWEIEVRRALRAGRLPLWSDRIDGGSSLWNNPQAGTLSPIYMAARLAPIEHHFLLALGLKLLVAFQGMWLLVRMLGVGRLLAPVAGAAFALSGAVMAWSSFPVSATAVWLPWLAAATITLVRRPNRKAIAATALVTAAMLLSGHPETAIGGGLLAIICSVSFFRRSLGVGGLVRGMATATAAGLLGFMLSAPHVLPFACFLPDTVRYHRMTADENDQQSSALLRNSRQARWFKTSLSTRPFGAPPFTTSSYFPIAAVGYAGLLSAAGFAILLTLRMRRAWPFVTHGIAIALLSVGFAPFADIVSRLPLVGGVAWPRSLASLSFCLVVCGALGLQKLSRRGDPWLVALGSAAIAATLVINADPSVVGTGVLAIVALGALARRRVLGCVVAALVTLIDLGPWAAAMIPRGDPDLFFPSTEFTESLREAAVRNNNPRVLGHGHTLYPSVLAAYGLEDLRYHNPVAESAYAQVLDATLDFHSRNRPYEYFSPVRRLSPIVDFLNVGIVVTSVPRPFPRLSTVYSETRGRRRAMLNPHALPRAFEPIDAHIVDASETLLVTASLADPWKVVISNRSLTKYDFPKNSNRLDSVKWTSDTVGRVTITAGSPGPRFVATSFTHPGAWRASSANGPIDTVTINHAFLGVIIPTGITEVDLRFVPPGFQAGVAIGFVALCVFVWLVISRPSPVETTIPHGLGTLSAPVRPQSTP